MGYTLYPDSKQEPVGCTLVRLLADDLLSDDSDLLSPLSFVSNIGHIRACPTCRVTYAHLLDPDVANPLCA